MNEGAKTCEWCGGIHGRRRCPEVRAIEFFEDGSMKRIEFVTRSDTLAQQHHHSAPLRRVASADEITEGEKRAVMRDMTRIRG